MLGFSYDTMKLSTAMPHPPTFGLDQSRRTKFHRSFLAVTSVVQAVRQSPLNGLGHSLLRTLRHHAVLATLLGVCDAVAGVVDGVGQGTLNGFGNGLLDDFGDDGVFAVVFGVGLADAVRGRAGGLLAVLAGGELDGEADDRDQRVKGRARRTSSSSVLAKRLWTTGEKAARALKGDWRATLTLRTALR